MKKSNKRTYILTAINTFLIVTFIIVVAISIVFCSTNSDYYTEIELAFWELKIFWPLILMWLGLGFLEFKLLQ